jgi:YqiJ-like protein
VLDGRATGEGTIELFLPEWAPFTIALLVMLAIGAVELASLLVGFSPSSAIESALPDVGIDVDAPDASGAELGPFSLVLGWLSVGRVPFLVVLVIFLTSFGIAGYLVQWWVVWVMGGPLNAWLAAIPALVAAAFATRHVGRWLGRVFPRDHSEAASQKELIGSYATIIRGEARPGQPAEAKAEDLRGRSHYILLEPSDADTTYKAGDRVFIVGQEKNVYRAVTKLNTQEG